MTRMRPVLIGLLASFATWGTLSAQAPYVANTAPRLPAARAWRVGPVVMQAGHAEDPAGLELSSVRAAIRLPDGRVVVANGGSSELVFLRSDGREQLRAGRAGEGPGEFRSPSRVGLGPNAEVWAADHRQRVVHYFDFAGKYLRTVSLKSFQAPGGLFPAGMLGDGRLVLYNAVTMLGGPAAGFDSTDVVTLDPRSNQATTIARIPKSDLGDPVGSKSFGAPLILLVGADAIWWGFGDQYRIHRLNPQGRRLGGLTRTQDPVPVTSRLWSQYVETRLAMSGAVGRTPEQLSFIRRELEEGTRASVLPAFGEALMDAGGNLWVKGFEVSGVLDPASEVFDPSGAWLTSVSMPDGFRPTDIGGDWILGLAEDSDGVESVVLRRLVKPAA